MSRPSDGPRGELGGDRWNPYHIIDGKWGFPLIGGGGEPRWIRSCGRYGFADADVIEWEIVDGAPQWVCVWIDADQAWRELTADETARLPELNT